MQLVQRGEARAFEVVYDRHCGAAFSLAYRMCGHARRRPRTSSRRRSSSHVALAARATTAPAAASARGCWASSTTARSTRCAAATVHERRRASDEGIEERFEARERTEVEAARREEARDGARSARRRCPTEQSRVIELAYFGGFTHTEIAEMLETPIGTVKGRMRLGLEKMRDALAAAGRWRAVSATGHARWTTTSAPTCSARCPTTRPRRSRRHLATCAELPRTRSATLRAAADALPLGRAAGEPPTELKRPGHGVVESEAELLRRGGQRGRSSARRAARRGLRGCSPRARDRRGAAAAACSRSAWSPASRSSATTGGGAATLAAQRRRPPAATTARARACAADRARAGGREHARAAARPGLPGVAHARGSSPQPDDALFTAALGRRSAIPGGLDGADQRAGHRRAGSGGSRRRRASRSSSRSPSDAWLSAQRASASVRRRHGRPATATPTARPASRARTAAGRSARTA